MNTGVRTTIKSGTLLLCLSAGAIIHENNEGGEMREIGRGGYGGCGGQLSVIASPRRQFGERKSATPEIEAIFADSMKKGKQRTGF